VGGEGPTERLRTSARRACENLESVRAVTTLSVVVVGRTVATLEWWTGCRHGGGGHHNCRSGVDVNVGDGECTYNGASGRCCDVW
jgi:hypothetical protein